MSQRTTIKPRAKTLLLLALFAAMAISLSAAPTAFGGSLQFHACAANISGDASPFYASSNTSSSTMAVYQWCQGGYGMVARNTVAASGTVPNGSYSAWVMDAPPGTGIIGFYSPKWANDGEQGYLSGLWVNGGFYYGCGPNDTGSWCSWALGDGSFWGSQGNQGGPDWSTGMSPVSQLQLRTQCTQAAGCPRNSIYGEAKASDITITLEADNPPSLYNGAGNLWTNNGWLSGYQTGSYDASDYVGIYAAYADIDGSSSNGFGTVNSGGCNYYTAIPCPNRGASVGFDTSRLSDGAHTLRFYAQDTAGNWADAGTHTFYVDNNAPAAPTALALGGGRSPSTWYATNGFTVNFTNPGTGGGSENQSTDVQLCPVINGAVDTNQCDAVRSFGNAAGTETINAPSAGEWQPRVRVHDALYTGAWSNFGPSIKYDPINPDRAGVDRANGWLNDAEARATDFRLRPPTTPPVSGVIGYAMTTDGSTPGRVMNAPVNASDSTYKVDVGTLPDGASNIQARAISGAGLASDIVNSQTVHIDRQAPTADATGATGATNWSKDDITLTLEGTDQSTLSGMTGALTGDTTITDGAYLTYSVDGGPNQYVPAPASNDQLVNVPTMTGSLPVTTDGAHVITLRATDLAGNDSAVKTYRVNIDKQAPTVATSGDTGSGWSRGDVTVGIAGTDQAGLSGMGAAPDTDPYTAGGYLSYELDGGSAHHDRGGSTNVAISDEGAHLLTVQATDVAGNGSVRKTVKVNIDKTAPTLTVAAPTAAPGDPSTVTLKASDALSGMDAGSGDTSGGYIQYQLDDGTVQTITGGTGTVTVPSDTSHTLRARAVDVAGNASDWQTTTFQDTTAPTGGLEPPDPNNPRLISFYVSESCIKSATIELRQAGGDWIPLETTIGDHHVSATVPDSIWNQPDRGSYEVRALVTDCAGNAAILDQFYGGPNSGQHAVITLKQRISTMLSAAFSKATLAQTCVRTKRRVRDRKTGRVRVKAVKVCPTVKPTKKHKPGRARMATDSTAVAVDAAKQPTKKKKAQTRKPAQSQSVYGVLTSGDGQPVIGQPVDIEIRPHTPASQWKTLATARTDAHGVVTFKVPVSPSLYVRLVFQQTEDLAGTQSVTLETAVTPKITIKATRRALRNGQAVTFSGTLLGGYIPAKGKALELDGFNPVKHKWVPVKAAGLHTDLKGHWKASYRFTATHRSTTYRFRVRALADALWPFQPTMSTTVSVHVMP